MPPFYIPECPVFIFSPSIINHEYLSWYYLNPLLKRQEIFVEKLPVTATLLLDAQDTIDIKYYRVTLLNSIALNNTPPLFFMQETAKC
jgi:hypothetical protein